MGLSFEFGSFRDPSGKVFFSENAAFRTVSEDCVDKVKTLLKMDFFKKCMVEGKIIKTKLVENRFSHIDNRFILEHEKIPFVTYPYEFSFYMLKEAAILTLDLLKSCLENNFILKDGTAWNCSYYNGGMVFFDVLSIDKYKPGQAWNGYQQFCKEFLYPLMLKAYKNINFQEIFKGTLDGVDPNWMMHWFRFQDILKPGVFKHIWLNGMLSKSKSVSKISIKDKYNLPQSALLRIVNNLLNIVIPLKSSVKESVWINYSVKNTYEKEDSEKKHAFLKKSLQDLNKKNTILDLGANVGIYSRIFSKACNVVSCDIDNDCIDVIYQKNSRENGSITPVVLNLMNPSSGCGWDLKERKSIFNRLKADAFLSLALIHHICIANNVPLEYFIIFLKSISKRGVIEWVDKQDPMVKFLLMNREDIFYDYTWNNFEKILHRYFIIKDKVIINNGNRILCFVESAESK